MLLAHDGQPLIAFVPVEDRDDAEDPISELDLHLGRDPRTVATVDFVGYHSLPDLRQVLLAGNRADLGPHGSNIKPVVLIPCQSVFIFRWALEGNAVTHFACLHKDHDPPCLMNFNSVIMS